MPGAGSARFDANVAGYRFSTAPKVRVYNAVENPFLARRTSSLSDLHSLLHMSEADALVLIEKRMLAGEISGWLELAQANEILCSRVLEPEEAQSAVYDFGRSWEERCEKLIFATFLGVETRQGLQYLNSDFYFMQKTLGRDTPEREGLTQSLATYFPNVPIDERGGFVLLNLLSPERVLMSEYNLFGQLMINLGMMAFIDIANEYGVLDMLSMHSAVFYASAYAAEAARVCVMSTDSPEIKVLLMFEALTAHFTMQYYYLHMTENERSHFRIFGPGPLEYSATKYRQDPDMIRHWFRMVDAGYIATSDEADIFTTRFLEIQGDHSRMQLNIPEDEKIAITSGPYRHFTQQVETQRTVVVLKTP